MQRLAVALLSCALLAAPLAGGAHQPGKPARLGIQGRRGILYRSHPSHE